MGFVTSGQPASGVALSGNFAYLAWAFDGLRAYDVSDPASPVEVGHADTPADARDVTVAGKFVYVAESMAGMEIYRECEGPLFADDFETGDCSKWSLEVP